MLILKGEKDIVKFGHYTEKTILKMSEKSKIIKNIIKNNKNNVLILHEEEANRLYLQFPFEFTYGLDCDDDNNRLQDDVISIIEDNIDESMDRNKKLDYIIIYTNNTEKEFLKYFPSLEKKYEGLNYFKDIIIICTHND